MVSTVGLLSGVSFAGLSSREVILSGVILILVEAISMAAGVYVSEDSEKELDPTEKENQLSDATVMLLSYAVIGLVPLSPYILIASTRSAFFWSIGLSLIALFCVGIFKGYFVHNKPLRGALKLTAIGAVVIAVSVLVGNLVQNY